MKIEERFKDITPSPEGPVFQRVDDRKEPELYLGIDSDGMPMLLLLSPHESTVKAQFQSLNAVGSRRVDGRFALTVLLVNRELYKVFICLCEDLITVLNDAAGSTANTADIVMLRLIKWQKLMDHGRDGILDEYALKGLLGELYVLEQVVIPRFGEDLSIEGWRGPLRSAQDFQLAHCLVEVKSCQPGVGSVHISSAAQLDAASGPILYLVVVDVERVQRLTAQAITISDLIARIRGALSGRDTAELFDERIAAAGYIDRREYLEKHYLAGPLRYYLVTGEFPRITRTDLRSGITDVNYEINLNLCAPFLRDGMEI